MRKGGGGGRGSASLEDAYLELAVAENIPDWNAPRRRSSAAAEEHATTEELAHEEQSPPLSSPTSRGSPTRPTRSPPPPAEAGDEPAQSSEEPREALRRTSISRKASNGDLVQRNSIKVAAEIERRPADSTTQPVEEKRATEEKEEPMKAPEQPPPKPRRTNFWGEARTVVLSKAPNETFGISIVGGRVEVSQKGGLPGTGSTVSGIFIKSVMPDSPAGRSGKMFMGDRVISVNDVDLRNATHEHAVQVIKQAENPVKFVVQSLQTQTTNASDSPRQRIEIVHHQAKAEQKMSEKSASTEPSSASATASEPTSPRLNGEKEHEPPEAVPSTAAELQAPLSAPDMSPNPQKVLAASTPSEAQKHVTRVAKRESMRKKIEPESAAALERLPEDEEEEDRFCYTKDKIKRKYGHLPGEPFLIRLENIPPRGLGLSLSGRSERNQSSLFVVDIKSTSPLPLLPGDELLEINGKILVSLTHDDATKKIRDCCTDGDEVALIILRHPDKAVDDSAARHQKKTADEHASVSGQASTASAKSTKSHKGEDGAEKIEELSKATTSTAEVNHVSLPPSSPGLVRPTTPFNDANATSPASLQSSPTTAENRKKSWQMERVNIEVGKETLIEIDKDGKGLGLSIVGGSDTVLGTVVIHEVYPDGAAAIDGRLKPGDQILEVNGVSLRGVSHEQAISLLRRTPSKVRLLIYRDVNLQLSLLDPTQIYNIFNIDVVKKPGRGLGISIVGRKNEPGVYISEIVKGGVAEADGRLMQGDQILSVNGTDTTASMQEDVATMLKTCTGKVSLKVGRWKLTETANRVHAAQPPTIQNNASAPASPKPLTKAQTNGSAAGPPTVTVTPEPQTPSTSTGQAKSQVPSPAPTPSWNGPGDSIPQVTIQDENQAVIHSDLSPVTEEPSSAADGKSTSDAGSEKSTAPPSPAPTKPPVRLRTDLHEEGSDDLLVELKKQIGHQWGMGIGKRPRGILVTSLQPGSTAAEKLVVGDRIMAVNGEPISDQHSAVTLVKSSGDQVMLQIARPRGTPTSGY
ncbi:Protein MPZ-1 i [Aphelenchoides avenae]|nr:Protein MPZ-1 i [Aphelenchus avenae]